MAIANMTNQSDVPQISRVISALVAPAFVKQPVAMGLIASQDVPEGQNTSTVGFQKEGSMTADALAEATARALDANGKRQDTAVDVSASKVVVVSGLSLENLKFNAINPQSYARSQASAIARYVDDEILAEFSDFTQTVNAGGTMTIDALEVAANLIITAKVPNPQAQLQFIGTPKAMLHIKNDIRTSSSPMYSNEKFLSVFNGNPLPNGYYGNIPGIDLYQTSGFAASGAQSVQGLFHPEWAIAGIFDKGIQTMNESKGGTSGLYTEITSYYFYGVGVWNDLAGASITLDA